MSDLFEQANKNSSSVGSMIMRLEKRLFLSNLALILLLVILIGLGIFWSTQLAVKSSLDDNRSITEKIVEEPVETTTADSQLPEEETTQVTEEPSAAESGEEAPDSQPKQSTAETEPDAVEEAKASEAAEAAVESLSVD